jgi:tetratricopeptide (TPR) repeat protein
MKNSRFTGVKALNNSDLRTNTPGLFPSPLPWDVVEKICRENNADALFSLELFDTESKISYTANPVSINTPLGNVPGIEHQATMLTTVKTGWRIYDPVGRNIIDEYPIARNITFSGKGINPVVAASGLIGRKEAVKEVGNKVGHDYALRIIPYWIRVSRDYYVKGTDNFKIARRKAQTGNWNDAADLWQKETTNSDGNIAGRACYNMAIISEINGDLDQAIQWSQKSYENYKNRLALYYFNILQNRKSNNIALKNQQSN